MKPIGFRLRAWESWTPDQSREKPDTAPLLLRRRVTPLGRQALSAAWGLPGTANARLILSSQHGEFSRTLSLLEAITNGDDISPADFTLSVHHALIGLLSIAHGNHHGHSAVAAGPESFCFGLLEAIACLTETPNEPVVLIHFDEPLPGPFSSFNEPHEQPVALALALEATGDSELFQFSHEPTAHNEKRSSSHALDFLDFLKNDSAEILSVGEHRQWRWARHAAV